MVGPISITWLVTEPSFNYRVSFHHCLFSNYFLLSVFTPILIPYISFVLLCGSLRCQSSLFFPQWVSEFPRFPPHQKYRVSFVKTSLPTETTSYTSDFLTPNRLSFDPFIYEVGDRGGEETRR